VVVVAVPGTTADPVTAAAVMAATVEAGDPDDAVTPERLLDPPLSPSMVMVSPASADDALAGAGEAGCPGTFAAPDVGPAAAPRSVAAMLVPAPLGAVAAVAVVPATAPSDAAATVAGPLGTPAECPLTTGNPEPSTVTAAAMAAVVAGSADSAAVLTSVAPVAGDPAPDVPVVLGSAGVAAAVAESATAESRVAWADERCAARAFSVPGAASSWERRVPASERSRASRRLRSNARASCAEDSVRFAPRRALTPVLASAGPVEGGIICAIIAILLT
jgi:hypothetical protein